MNHIIKDISEFIFIENKPEKADVIIVAGGSFPEPAEIAADLWKAKYAPKIFIGGGVSVKLGKFPGPRTKRDIYSKDYKTEYDFYKDVLHINGVSENAIFGEDRSSSTRENAVFAKQFFENKRIKINRALLVCKSFHARRCLMFFQSAFPQTDFLIIPFAGFGITKWNWFKTEYGVQRTLGELSRCGNQFSFFDITNYSDEQDSFRS